MKRRIVAATSMDVLGEVASNVTLQIKNSMIDCGFDESDVEKYYSVELQKLDSYGQYEITASMELSYSTAANSVIPKLNEIVSSFDPDAYFDCVQAGIWVCVLNINGNSVAYKLNKGVVGECVQDCIRLLNKLYETEFQVIRQTLRPSTKDNNSFDVFVFVESETLQSKVAVHIDMDDYKNKGASTVKSDLVDMMLDALREHMEQF